MYRLIAALVVLLIAFAVYRRYYSSKDPTEDPEWVRRMNEIFTLLDVNDDGYVSLEDWMLWVENVEKDISPDSKLVDRLRKSMEEFCGPRGIGLTSGMKITRDKFVRDIMVRFAAAEGSKKLREDTLVFQMCNAWYDIVDTTYDGMVTIDEYKKAMKARNYVESVAEETFKLLDKDQDGKIERSKLIESEFHFWFSTNGTPEKKVSLGILTHLSHHRRLNKFRMNTDWVYRMNEVFKVVDISKKGYITVEDWELWIDNIERDISPDPTLVAKLRKSLREFCGAEGIGLTPGKKATLEEFLNDLMPKFSAAQGDMKLRGESLLYQLNQDWFNIVDTANDGIWVTLDGYKKVMKACNFDDSAAEATFQLLDKENVGKVERSKLIEMEFNFWFTPGHQESKGMFGDTFELK